MCNVSIQRTIVCFFVMKLIIHYIYHYVESIVVDGHSDMSIKKALKGRSI